MPGIFFAAASALWFGVLMAISPCPMAGNVVAISYLGRRLGSPRQVLFGGILYTVGRTVAYVGLAVLILASLQSIPRVSAFLQEYMNKALGPILIVVGLFLLELIKLGGGSRVSEKLGRKVEGWGLAGALALGIIFALSFCPISAALFFGSLISLAVKYQSRVLLPAAFGVGTGLPVFIFAVIIGLGVGSLGAAFHGRRLHRRRRLLLPVFHLRGKAFRLMAGGEGVRRGRFRPAFFYWVEVLPPNLNVAFEPTSSPYDGRGVGRIIKSLTPEALYITILVIY